MIIYYLIPLFFKISYSTNEETIFKNFEKIYSTIKNNFDILFRFAIFSTQAFLCLYFMINLFPKNEICKSLINDYKEINNIYTSKLLNIENNITGINIFF